MTARGFEALTPKQQEQHRNHLSVFGIDVSDTLKHHISSATTQRPVRFTTDLHNTAIHPKIVVVKDVATMKKYGGIPDSHYETGTMNDDHIAYPPAWNQRYDRLIEKAGSQRKLVQTLSAEQLTHIRKAMKAYVAGHSKAVQSYEAMINAVHFPQYVAVFAGNTLCVPANTVVVIGPDQTDQAATPMVNGDAYVVTFASICIEEGGQIQFSVPTHVTVTGTVQKVPAGQCNCPH